MNTPFETSFYYSVKVVKIQTYNYIEVDHFDDYETACYHFLSKCQKYEVAPCTVDEIGTHKVLVTETIAVSIIKQVTINLPSELYTLH